MPNYTQIRVGSTVPEIGHLQAFQLGYCTEDGLLYIGVPNDDEDIVPSVVAQDGADGADGVGVPSGGTDRQVLTKDGATDYATKWAAPRKYPGEMFPFGGSTAPAFSLPCDGSAVSRTTYADLFAAVGTVWGAGDGSTTFNLPNLAGRTLIGAGAGYALGGTGGAETHTLTEPQIASHTHIQNFHNHTQNSHTHIQNSHSHYVPVGTNPTTSLGAYRVSRSWDGENPGNIIAEHATATNKSTTATNISARATNQNAGGGEPHNNMQPYAVVNYYIAY